MEASAEDLNPPDSWEVADLDASVSRLMISPTNNKDSPSPSKNPPSSSSSSSAASNELASSTVGPQKAGEDAFDSVDEFLREALKNPRERLSVLRMEQDIEKFIRDPTQQQMEFQQLPTSYLRLAAHRVAQHYSLQSMVLLDDSLPDGSGSRIIVRKTFECRLPSIRLADIPVNLPTEDSGVTKVAIKQRPQKRSPIVSSANSHSAKSNSKSVEERKEEYNRARARIFSSNSFSGSTGGRAESEPRVQDNNQHNSFGMSRAEEKAVPGGSDVNIGRGLIDSSTSSSRLTRNRTENELVGRSRTNSKVAILRDRDVDRKDPDYDRNYDRYMQRFDPGFGFNGGPYVVQPMYSPALTYNTEFPHLGSAHRPTEHQPQPLPQHLAVPWAARSAPAGFVYGHPDAMMTPFSPNHSQHAALYLHSAQYPSHHAVMPFIHPHEQQQRLSQSHQQQLDASFGLARPR